MIYFKVVVKKQNFDYKYVILERKKKYMFIFINILSYNVHQFYIVNKNNFDHNIEAFFYNLSKSFSYIQNFYICFSSKIKCDCDFESFKNEFDAIFNDIDNILKIKNFS